MLKDFYNNNTTVKWYLRIWDQEVCPSPGTRKRKLPLLKKASKNGDGVLVGYPNKKGCFHACTTPEGVVIRFYREEPKEVSTGTLVPCYQCTLQECPGWGFDAMALLRRRMV